MIDPELAALRRRCCRRSTSRTRSRHAQASSSCSSPSGSTIPGVETLDIEDRLVSGLGGRPGRGGAGLPADGGRAGARCRESCMIHGGGFVIGSVEAEHAGAASSRSTPARSSSRSSTAWRPSTRTRPACTTATPRWTFARTPRPMPSASTPSGWPSSARAPAAGWRPPTALLARDRRRPAVCFQMLHIPELDDRLETPSMRAFVDSPVWNRPLAEQSWRAYLGDLRGPADVPPYAAPARATDLSGLPPGLHLDGRERSAARRGHHLRARGCLQAGVSVELHQFPGTFHGSALVTTAAVSRRAQREAALVLRGALGVDAG